MNKHKNWKKIGRPCTKTNGYAAFDMPTQSLFQTVFSRRSFIRILFTQNSLETGICKPNNMYIPKYVINKLCNLGFVTKNNVWQITTLEKKRWRTCLLQCLPLLDGPRRISQMVFLFMGSASTWGILDNLKRNFKNNLESSFREQSYTKDPQQEIR